MSGIYWCNGEKSFSNAHKRKMEDFSSIDLTGYREHLMNNPYWHWPQNTFISTSTNLFVPSQPPDTSCAIKIILQRVLNNYSLLTKILNSDGKFLNTHTQRSARARFFFLRDHAENGVWKIFADSCWVLLIKPIKRI